jgi:DNA-binding NarL/FixJ family response regulator
MLKGDPDIELVLLDLGLPPDVQGISEGVRFLREVRLWNAFLKVVVVTGQSHDDALLSFLE